uniref:UBA domain-containing protein n=1 Tax=Ciona intestinalis TaxID=7719 RepID=F6V2L0_CIOIN
QATADQIRLAQMISNNGREDDVEMHNSVEKIIEITGTSEDIARTALYDTNNDTNRAIELILEGGSFNQKNEWETATRRKGKTVPTSGQSNDSYDEEIKDDFTSQNNRERSDNRGRGRGKGKGKRGKSGDRDRTAEDDTRGLESRDRQRGGRRGRGRGNSNAGRGGRYPARGPRRFARYNRGGYNGPRHQTDANNQNEFDDGFGTFNKHDDTTAPTEAWGTESWNDDLTETKVFQSQNTMSAPISGALPSTTISNHMGERIDIDSLFKKNHPGTTTDGSYKANDGLVFNNSSSTHHSPPSVIQQLQQQGQVSLFRAVFGVIVCKFGVTRLSPYVRLVSPYAQYNGKVSMDEQKGSALLGTFGEQFKGPDQSTMLGQISDITKSAFTVIKPFIKFKVSITPYFTHMVYSVQKPPSIPSQLGLPPVTSEQVEASRTMPPGLPQSQHNTLSFGAPQSVISQPKQQRRKQNKIPASAVEMPGSGGGGYHELSSFDLQFGVDDHSSAPPDFEQSNATNQSNLYNQSHPSHSHSYYTSTSLAQQSQQSGPDMSNSAGKYNSVNLASRSIRSPIPTSSLPSSLQVSPMAHITGTPSVISSLASGLGQTHITPHVGSTPTKLTPSTSAPINISKAVSPSSTPLAGSLTGGAGYMNMQMPYRNVTLANSSMQSQNSMIPSASSPGKHLSSNDLYTSAGHPSSHPGHQSSTTSSNTLGSALGGATLPSAANVLGREFGVGANKNNLSDTNKPSSLANASKAGPPNLPLGVPPLLANQYGIPVAPGLMTAYTPEALYGYTDPLMAVQSRVPSYYDMSSFHNTSNQSASSASVNRDSTSATSSQGKFGRGEPSSPTP